MNKAFKTENNLVTQHFNELMHAYKVNAPNKEELKADFRGSLKEQLTFIKKLRTANEYRYFHSYLMLDGIIAILNNDYSLFVRFADKARERGEHILTPVQFKNIQQKTYPLLKDNLLFVILLCLTHDYGTIHGDAQHFVRSGELCRGDFENFGFPADQVELATMINGNHSFIGDLLLGEAPRSYASTLKEAVLKINAKVDYTKDFFKYLWLITIFDINAAYRGFLTSEKYEQIQNLDNYESLINLYGQDYFPKRLSLLNNTIFEPNSININKVKTNFDNIYLQYFHDIFNPVDESKKPLSILTPEEMTILLNQLIELWEITHPQSGYNFITLSTDTSALFKTTVLKERIIQYIKHSASRKIDFSPSDYDIDFQPQQKSGSFLGLPFEINKNYLEIKIIPENKTNR